MIPVLISYDDSNINIMDAWKKQGLPDAEHHFAGAGQRVMRVAVLAESQLAAPAKHRCLPLPSPHLSLTLISTVGGVHGMLNSGDFTGGMRYVEPAQSPAGNVADLFRRRVDAGRWSAYRVHEHAELSPHHLPVSMPASTPLMV